jgi:NCS2 family nucleobase:cation symporter-2
MRYGADDPSPPVTTWLAGLQYAGITTAYVVFPLVLLREADVPAEIGAGVIAMSFLILGLATLVQAGRWTGPGMLLPATFTAAYLVPAIAAAKLGGLPLAFGMVVFAGCVEVLLSVAFRRLRVVFPPEVSGLVVLLVGLTIGEIAVRNLAALGQGPAPGAAWLALLACFGLAAGVAVWGRGRLASFPVLLGLVGGYLAAVVLGLLGPEERAAIAAAPLLAPPSVAHLGLAFDPALALPFVIGALAATTKAAALSAMAAKAAGPAHAGDTPGVMARAVRADGIGTILAGLLGTIGVNPAPSAAALVTSTGLASRRIAWSLAAICAAIALVPPLALAIVLMPRAVVSGVLLFTGCLVLANGMQMLAEVKLDQRRSLVVGLGVFGALAALAVPDLGKGLPAEVAPILGSPFILGSAVALVANLVLRIGSRRTLRFTVTEPASPAAWPQEVPAPAREAALALLERLPRGTGPVEVTLRLGEFSGQVRVRLLGDAPDRDGGRRSGLPDWLLRHPPGGADEARLSFVR